MSKEKKNQGHRTAVKVNDYVIVDSAKHTVVIYAVKSRGQLITGVAKCNRGDKFEMEVGKQIAYKRCQLKQRQRDLELVKRYILAQEHIASLMEKNDGLISRNFQRAIQRGYDERFIQYQNINRLKKEIDALCKKGLVALNEQTKKKELVKKAREARKAQKLADAQKACDEKEKAE